MRARDIEKTVLLSALLSIIITTSPTIAPVDDIDVLIIFGMCFIFTLISTTLIKIVNSKRNK